MQTMRDLIGWRCRVEFSLDPMRWPFPGFPAWVVVNAVDMPMVLMADNEASKGQWINTSIIQSIEGVQAPEKRPKPLVRFAAWRERTGPRGLRRGLAD